MHVLVIVGSSREDSVNAKLAATVRTLLPSEVTSDRFDDLTTLPHYTQDLDSDPAPAVVQELRDAVAKAQALVVVTPEYNASIPGTLKCAIDWASRPRANASIAGKPVAVLGASPSPGGTASARAHLVAILERAGAKPLETTVGVASAFEHFDGDELTDETVRRQVQSLVDELVQPVPA